MAISKIILNGVTQMDVTQDTVAAANLLLNETATGADGQQVVGAYVPASPTLQTKSVSYTPTESAQSATVTADQGYDGLEEVNISVGAISSSYVGSAIDRRDSTDLSASGATVTAPAGYYESAATKSVASGTAGTPSATKGAVSNHSVSVTPSVTNTAGYISGGTITGTDVTVYVAELESGTKSITENGTGISVSGYSAVDVNVSGGGGWTPEQMAKREITGIINLGSATDVPESLFRDNIGITGIIGNSIITIGNNGFRGCRPATISLPNAETIGQYAFSGFNGNINLPKAVSFSLGGYYFSYSPGGGNNQPAVNIAIVLPALTGQLPSDIFRACYAKYIDLGEGVTSLNTRTFYMGASDTIVILRNKNQVVTAAGTNPIVDIRAGWKIYVPSSLVSSYENDTNWSTKGNIFYAIEGSQFENYYADGTPIPTT